MPSGQDLVNAAARFRGERYVASGARCSATSGYKDCSGLVSAALNALGLFGACGTSTSIEIWARSHGGGYVSRDYAMNTPGVGCAIWGTGAQGHIGISAGGGRTIETPSAEGHQVGFSPMSHDRWGEWFTFPGISYGGASEPAKPQQKDETRMFNVVGADGEYWVYEGVRITPAGAYNLASRGVVAARVNEAELERGMAGQDPTTGANDRQLAPRIVQNLRGGNVLYAAQEAHEANLRAIQTQERLAKVLEHLGIPL